MAHLLIVVSQRYNYEEFWVTLRILKHRGHTFDIVSTGLKIRPETSDKINVLSKTVYEIPSMAGYAGIVIISGNPKDTEKYWHDKHAQMLVKQAVENNIVIAGICAAVPAVRLATRNKKVSYFPLIKSRELLEENGAILIGTSLAVDGKLVTAENEAMTEMWATNIADVLEDKLPTYILEKSSFKRKEIPRKDVPELEYLKKVIKDTGKTGVKDD
jgi:putative intracellular protease/amidase